MIVYHDSGGKALFREFFEASGLSCTPLYRNYPLRFIYRNLRTHVPKKLIFRIPKLARDEDKIIVFDTLVTPQYLYWLCQNYPEKRVLLWYWNPAGGDRKFDFFPRRVEIWSYSPADCDKYGFRYNSQFYFDCLIPDNEGIQAFPDTDKSDRQPLVFFIGREKGRKQEILNIKMLLEQNGAETEFHFMKDGTKANRLAETVTPYREVVKMIQRCDVLLDYTLNGNAGLSLRPMEALFFGKKLITNQKNIRQYDFYRSENIYILDSEERTIREFLKEPYVMIDRDIRDYYRLSNWIKRFDTPEDEKT